jgi:hypothetical protein
MKKTCAILFLSASLASCGKEATKKLLVLGRGELTANGTSVVMKDGAGHIEKIMEVDKDVNELSIDVGSGAKSIKVPTEEGYYVLNLKKDTVISSKQDIGADLSRNTVISQESLQGMIDSMQQLITGSNLQEGKTVLIAPQQVKKIASKPSAQVFGPFTGIPSSIDAGDDGKAPDIYKLFTNTQLRERIANYKKATVNLEK